MRIDKVEFIPAVNLAIVMRPCFRVVPALGFKGPGDNLLYVAAVRTYHSRIKFIQPVLGHIGLGEGVRYGQEGKDQCG